MNGIDKDARIKELEQLVHELRVSYVLQNPCINDDPILFSLLYDLDLLPEQVKEGTPNWVRMQIIIEHWNKRVQPKDPPSDDFIEADRYARSLFKQLHPECELLDSPSGVLTQIDNAIAGYRQQLEDYIKAAFHAINKLDDLDKQNLNPYQSHKIDEAVGYLRSIETSTVPKCGIEHESARDILPSKVPAPSDKSDEERK